MENNRTERKLSMKNKLHITKKQILIFVFLLVLLFITIIVILEKTKKAEDVVSENDITSYIVTESFIENSDGVSKYYESRFNIREKKAYLVLVEENGVQTEKTLMEIETKFTKENRDIILGDEYNAELKDLNRYADDSGFVYKCSVDEIQGFLTNEALDGKIRFAHETPAYYECYLEKGDGEIMRGLLIYDSDMKNGTLIYKQCKEGIRIPAVLDAVTAVESSEKQ